MRPILRPDVPLAPFNTFGIAANARCFVRIESLDALRELREMPVWSNERRLILGGGSNLLFTGDYDGLVVQIAMRGIEQLGDDGDAHLVAADAGESWDAFVRHTVDVRLPGLENLVSIPGSVGAAPVQNIGAYGIELVERFGWLEAFDVDDGSTTTMDAAACAFAYRDSVFKRVRSGRTIITRVVFRLPIRWTPRRGYADVEARLAQSSIDRPTARQMLEAVAAIRRDKLPDPAAIGNAGSFFKNPVIERSAFDALRAREPDVVGHDEPDGRVKVAAGWLIDRLGWRGRSLPGSNGRAAVHERQALVLVNRGGASGRDVLDLADAIRDDVAARYAIELVPEPIVV